jgi:polysaccharide biosynthesis protein PslH
MESTESWRTLILARMLYPPMGGEYLRNWQTINLLKQFGPVAVCSLFDRQIDPPQQTGIDFWHPINLAADRSLQSQLESITQWFKQAGLTYYCPYQTSIAETLTQTITTFQPDLVILEQLWMIPYLPIIQRYPCQVIYDAHNIEVPLYEQTKCVGAGLRSLARRILHIPQIQRSEQQLLQQTDQVWVCSRPDQEELCDRYRPTHLPQIIPNGLDSKFYAGLFQERLRQERSRLTHNVIFIGNFAHVPNGEAVSMLLREIYPELRRQFPQTRLLLVGRNPTPAMLKAAQADDQITVTGEVEDIRPYLATARVMVTPLLQGSGTRLKILEAFAAGCPVVSTAKGAEGLQVQDGEQYLRAEGSAAIVAAVQRLWSDPVLEMKLIKSAQGLLQSAYSWEAVHQTIGSALEQLRTADAKRTVNH